MRSHVCTHPNGKSHICDCKLPEGHGSFQNGCTKYGPTGDRTQVEPGSESTVFTRVIHSFEGSEVCTQCGAERETALHPHVFRQGDWRYNFCVCGSNARGLIHQMTQI